jgi:hypothetical protein
MQRFLAVLIFASFGRLFACECPPLAPITKELCKDYNVIFLGKVDSIAPCDTKGNAIAFFTITELYKGNSERTIKINFDCSSECLMSFAKNEDWLVYAKYEKFDRLRVQLCEHSRKKYPDNSQDIYMTGAHRSFGEEKEFLKETFGIQAFLQVNDLNRQQQEMGPRNEQPSASGKVLLLLISLLVMGLVWFFTRKKK